MRRRLVAFALTALAACAPVPEAPPGAEPPPAEPVAVAAFGPTFTDAVALATDPFGRLYVADAGRDVVVELDPAGAVLRTLGGPGTGADAFLDPSGLDPTNGLALWVADAGNGRVQRFSAERALLETLAVPLDAEAVLAGRPAEPTGRPTAVAASPAGPLFVLDAARRRVLRFDENRALERLVGGPEDGAGTLREPVALAAAPDGRLFVADRGHAAVLAYDPFGTFVRRYGGGLARDVRGVHVSAGRLLVTLPDRVLVYDAEGALAEALAPATDAPLRAAIRTESGLVVLTARRLWRVGA